MSAVTNPTTNSGYNFTENQYAGIFLDQLPGWTSTTDISQGSEIGSEEPALGLLVHDKRSLDQADSSSTEKPTLATDILAPPPPTKRPRQRKRISDPDVDYLPQKTVLEIDFAVSDMDVQAEASPGKSADPKTPQPEGPVQAPTLTVLPAPRSPPVLTVPLPPFGVVRSPVKVSDYDYAEDVDSEDEDVREKDKTEGVDEEKEEMEENKECHLTVIPDKPESPHTVWQNKRLQEIVAYTQANMNNKTNKPFKFSARTAFGPVRELRVKLVHRVVA